MGNNKKNQRKKNKKRNKIEGPPLCDRILCDRMLTMEDLDYVRRGPSIDLLYGPDIIKRKQGSTERWKMISRKEVHELLSRVHSKRLEECSVEDIDAMIASLVACIKKLSEDFYDITLDVLKVADRVRLRQLRTTQDRFRRSLTLKGQEESVANMGESSIYCGQ